MQSRTLLSHLCLGLGCATAWGQQPAPIGILRGKVAQVPTSEIIDFRTMGGLLYRCSYDTSTLTERDRTPIAPVGLKPSEWIEVTTDRKYGRCYARTIRVIDGSAAVITPAFRPLTRSSRALEQMFPRGNLTYAGVVLRHSKETLVLRTRKDGEKVLLIRDDTRFLESGAPVELSRLVPNTRVFVRAGNNYENELEVYQVIWGAIDGPSPGTP